MLLKKIKKHKNFQKNTQGDCVFFAFYGVGTQGTVPFFQFCQKTHIDVEALYVRSKRVAPLGNGLCLPAFKKCEFEPLNASPKK